jgi:hypothetical protein
MRLNSKIKAFSLVEILITMVFLSLAFLPLFNLFQFGTKGTTNNLNEVAATNYASDMINFVREISFFEFSRAAGTVENFRLANDSQIKAFFNRIGLKPPPDCREPFSRSIEVRKFKGKDARLFGWLSDWLKKRQAVPNYLVSVKVEFPRPAGPGEKDKVTLYTIVMD